MVLGTVPLTNNEHSLIFTQHFGINFQMAGKGGAPQNDWGLILTATIQFFFSFVFAMLGCLLPTPWSWLCWVCVALIIFFRVLSLGVFIYAVMAGKYLKSFYHTSILYWGWWPKCLLIGCIGSSVLGALIGEYMWTTCFDPYFQLRALQMYKDVNPSRVPGERVQDAGLVDFSSFVEPDRGKGGCFMNKGNTYCIAPIVLGGEVGYGLTGTPRTGSFDYFAVGINCCTCPNRDFQCGDWRNPLAQGGLRSLDYKSRPFYKLALDDWAASYNKASKNPLFFEWVQAPEWKWKGMWNRGLQLFWMSLAGAFSIALTLGFLLDKILQFLYIKDIITPRAVFAPGPYAEVITELLLPKMFYRYQQEQAQMWAMPVTTEFKPQAQMMSAEEERDLKRQYGTMQKDRMANRALTNMLAPPGAQMGAFGAVI
jgi:hypothetical protein